MYFATYKVENEEMIGLVTEDQRDVVSLNSLYDEFGGRENLGPCPKDMQQFIEGCNNEKLEKLSSLMENEDLRFMKKPLEDVQLLAPIPYPRRNVFCVGKNYMDHAKEVGAVFGSIPENPTFFSKVAYPAIGHGAYIDSHGDIVKELDYEVELALVIGKEGKNISKEEAYDHIFGYTILNDVSARVLQKKHEQWHKGKSLDTFCPMGPFLVHKREVASPYQLDITCSVNGEIRQNSNTKNLIFDIPTIIHVLSQGMTLKPGDIIATGTPAGVGMGFSPGKFLKPGDVVECGIEGIGKLKNQVK